MARIFSTIKIVVRQPIVHPSRGGSARPWWRIIFSTPHASCDDDARVQTFRFESFDRSFSNVNVGARKEDCEKKPLAAKRGSTQLSHFLIGSRGAVARLTRQVVQSVQRRITFASRYLSAVHGLELTPGKGRQLE